MASEDYAAAPAAVEALVLPLDRLRNRVLKAFVPLSGALAGHRSTRVAAWGVGLISLSCLLAVGAPFWLLALSPILLGVPHLVSDVRYCVVRPGFHRRVALWAAVGIPLGLGAVLAAPEVGLAAVAGAAAASRGSGRWAGVRRLAVVLIAAACALGIMMGGRTGSLVLVHGHNLVAVVLWWTWRRRDGLVSLLPLLLFIGVAVALGLGAFDGAVGFLSDSSPTSLGMGEHLGGLAPGLGELWGARLVLAYAFAQSVHYAIWLRLVPEDDRVRVSPRTFRATARALFSDMSGPLLLAATMAALGLAIWAAFDLAHARNSYLRFVEFHVLLELAAMALFVLEGRPTAANPRVEPEVEFK